MKKQSKFLAILLALVMVLGGLPFGAQEAYAAGIYSTEDINVINDIIENNKLAGMTKETTTDGSSVPEDWGGIVIWDDSTPKRVTELDLYKKSMTGTLDVSGLTALTELYCSKNQLTSLDVSGLTALTALDCSENQLISLDVSGLATLQNSQQQYTCPHCKGTGREHLIPDFLDIITGDWADNKCPNCQGTGKVKDPSKIRTNTGWFG